jgi:hypothetical protein
MAHPLGSGLGAWGLLAAVGLLACGQAADGSGGAESKGVADRQRQEAELAALDDGAALIASDVEAPPPAAQCDSSRACRGGLLSGTWEVVANCTSQQQPRRALQAFGKPFLSLDNAACPGAVQLRSEWSGGFAFGQGVFEDRRLRSDQVELDLTRECLSATLGKVIDERHLGAACASLGESMSQCSVVSGVCHCSGSNEEQLTDVGSYGVLGDRDAAQVVLGADDTLAKDTVDYCVEGDLLHWRQQTDSVELVLRRTALAPEATDPSRIR